jgi:hypothetical protein
LHATAIAAMTDPFRKAGTLVTDMKTPGFTKLQTSRTSTIPTEFVVPAGTRFQIEARFNGQIVDLASGEVVIEKGANVTWCALPTPNIWVGKERLVLHDGARAGSRTLNLGIKSLSTGSLREDQRGSGSLNRS